MAALRIDKKYFLPFLLVAFTLVGLAEKFLLALNTNLNSDSVVPGLEAMEIFKYGDVFLGRFYFPTNYPAIFTDLVPFHLIPQLVTGYDPNAVRLTGFLIFVLLLAVYAAIIYKVTGDQVKALIFMALLSNLTPMAYAFFKEPVAHGATFLLTGALIFVLIDYEKMRAYQKAIIAIVVFLVSFSDNLALAIIAIPVTLALIYTRARAGRMTPGAVIGPAFYLLLPGLASYILKFFLPSMVPMDIWLITTDNSMGTALGSLPDKLLLYIKYMLSVFNDQLTAALANNIGPLEILSLALIALFIYSLWNGGKGYKKYGGELKLFLLILLISNIVIFLGFMLTSLNGARYLMLGSLSIFVIISLGYDKRKIYLAMVTAAIILGIIACAIAVSHLDYTPNKEEYGLINYLEENNLTTGYSDYWDSNIITYLSGENIRVRAIAYRNGYIVPYQYRILSSSRWYTDRPTKFFILYRVGNDFGNIAAVTSAVEWERMTKYGNYYIFIYDMDHSPMIGTAGT